MNAGYGAERIMLLAFLLMIAYGFQIGETIAMSDRVGEEELGEAVATPIATVSDEEYEEFQNKTAEAGNQTVAKLDEYGALVIVPENNESRFGGEAIGIIRETVSSIIFPARLSAPWGYKYPGWATPAARVTMGLWFLQLSYLIHRGIKQLRGGGHT